MALAKKDDQLTDKQGKTYIIQRFLGEGVTAEVYEAVDGDGVRSALKILRPELPADIKQSFRNEGVILGQLATYGREKYPEWAEPLVPQVYGQTAPNTTPEFLALEFVSGQSLDELIAEKGGVEEKTSLKIARQILQVLVVLHEKLHRSYTDFQLKNIWCLAGTELTKNPTIKIMDWNHVSDEEKSGRPPALVPNDLIRFGAYLFQLLTGKGALQTGETEAELLKRAGTKWSEISVATRAVLKKALHPRPEERYQTAAALLADVQELIALWEGDIDDLFDTATKTMRAAQKYTTEELRNIPAAEYANYNNLLFTAEKSLDIYLRRDPQSSAAERLRGDLSRITAEVSFLWKAGHNFYEAEIFSEALSRWETEAQNLQRLDLWRWVLLARMGKELGTEQFKKVQKAAEEAVTALATQKWQTALDKLAPIRQQNNQLGWLYQEAQLRLAGEDARRLTASQDWGKAAESYKQMLSLLPQIGDKTYAQWIASEVGTVENLQAHIQKSLAAGQSAAAGQQVVSEFKAKAQQGGAGIRYLTDKLLENPHQPALLQAVVEQSRQMQLHQAVELLSTAAFFGQSYPAVQEQLRDLRQKLAQERKQAELTAYQQELEQKRREEQAIEEANRQRTINTNNAKLAQAIDGRNWLEIREIIYELGGGVEPTLQTKMTQLFEEARQNNRWTEAIQWGNVLLTFSTGSWYTEIQEKVHELGQWQAVNELLQAWEHNLHIKNYGVAGDLQNQAEDQLARLLNSPQKQKFTTEIEDKKKRLAQALTDLAQNTPITELPQIFARLPFPDLNKLVDNMSESLNKLQEKYDGVNRTLTALHRKRTASPGFVLFSSFVVLVVLLGAAAAGGYWFKTAQLDPLNNNVQRLVTQVSASPALPTAEVVNHLAPLETRLASIENSLTPTATITPSSTGEITSTTLAPLSLTVTQGTLTPSVEITSFVELSSTYAITISFTNGEIKTYDRYAYYDLILPNGWVFIEDTDSKFVAIKGDNTQYLLQSSIIKQGVVIKTTYLEWSAIIAPDPNNLSIIRLPGGETEKWFETLQDGDYEILWFADKFLLTKSGIFWDAPIKITTNYLRAKPLWDGKQVKDKTGEVLVYGVVCTELQSESTAYFLLATTLIDDTSNTIYWLPNSQTPPYNTTEKNIPEMQALIKEFKVFEECIDSVTTTE